MLLHIQQLSCLQHLTSIPPYRYSRTRQTHWFVLEWLILFILFPLSWVCTLLLYLRTSRLKYSVLLQLKHFPWLWPTGQPWLPSFFFGFALLAVFCCWSSVISFSFSFTIRFINVLPASFCIFHTDVLNCLGSVRDNPADDCSLALFLFYSFQLCHNILYLNYILCHTVSFLVRIHEEYVK